MTKKSKRPAPEKSVSASFKKLEKKAHSGDAKIVIAAIRLLCEVISELKKPAKATPRTRRKSPTPKAPNVSS